MGIPKLTSVAIVCEPNFLGDMTICAAYYAPVSTAQVELSQSTTKLALLGMQRHAQ